MRIIFIGLMVILTSVLFISCSQDQGAGLLVVEDGMDLCKSPHGGTDEGCCIDRDANGICDADEINGVHENDLLPLKEAPTAEPGIEDEISDPIADAPIPEDIRSGNESGDIEEIP
ncbi:hypothetical protein COV93_07360 [Candidatus Woesearchaeota archaeon CG11_big_fil_rev_8_21_14_0_20_43_8]|nr:MAG: hypothetical protein COV93_07360 [Candidatus Woesearchaeota archaeon CG11_big_fil_rev_8_21_14_0_20_43_8]PIO08829.1 MAG: hypothetical protein COT47_00985 [Candidatus Woesearchaeota archaeon CG08_land_8_20_14_0_20_43_7]